MKKCAKPKCKLQAIENSNYCVIHKPEGLEELRYIENKIEDFIQPISKDKKNKEQ